MENLDLEFLKYPIGKFEYDANPNDQVLSQWITSLEQLPQHLSDLVSSLNEEQLDTPYRSEGWTVRQVIHHIGDSHHHSYTRFKWALTEDKPLIKAYEEKEWSKLFDASTAPIQMSLTYIAALHEKLVYLLRGISKADLEKYYLHPEGNITVTVRENIAKYAWHGKHHYTQIENLLKRKGWL